MDDDIVFHHTYYFINELIPENARQQLPHTYLNYFRKTFIEKMQRRWMKLRLRFFKYVDYPFLKTAEIFACDIPYGSLCIGNRPYSLLPDSPNCLTLNTQYDSAEYLRMIKHANSLLGKLQRLLFGDVFVHYIGHNMQCKSIYLNMENVSPVLNGKEVHIQSFSSLWENATDLKKEFIMRLFDITLGDIEFLNSRPNLFFSQPMMKDCGLTEMEYVGILSKIFQNYPPNSVIVKTHPRDTFDYAGHFPDVAVFSKSVNSQLLNFIGVSPQKIITINSTAIEGFPESIECDYYGSHIHPKLEQHYGMVYKPDRLVNFK
jgi:hypothetical protein